MSLDRVTNSIAKRKLKYEEPNDKVFIMRMRERNSLNFHNKNHQHILFEQLFFWLNLKTNLLTEEICGSFFYSGDSLNFMSFLYYIFTTTTNTKQSRFNIILSFISYLRYVMCAFCYVCLFWVVVFCIIFIFLYFNCRCCDNLLLNLLYRIL